MVQDETQLEDFKEPEPQPSTNQTDLRGSEQVRMH